MMTSVAINIMIFENVKLGPPDGLKWLQEEVSVPYWRAYWNNAAGAFIKDASGELELTPDFVTLIPPRTVYSTRTEQSAWHFYIHFTVPAPFDSISPNIRIFRNERLLSFASELAGELRNSPPNARTMLKMQRYLCDLLLAIPDTELSKERPLHPSVDTALALLDANPGISIGRLAEKMKMSRSALIQLFSRTTGSTPQKLARRRRLERASMLLHFSDKTIKQIAEETGFCDRYHFSRLFKREFSYGPAEFRAQMDAYKANY
jgi:AraC-like DNA-binding protein